MPGDFIEVQIFHTVAVNVNFVLAGETLKALGNASFSAVPLIDEGRDDRDSSFGRGPVRPSRLAHGIGITQSGPPVAIPQRNSMRCFEQLRACRLSFPARKLPGRQTALMLGQWNLLWHLREFRKTVQNSNEQP